MQINKSKHSLLNIFLMKIERHSQREEWRRKNSFNDTQAVNQFNFDNVSVGKYSYGELNVVDSRDCNKLVIGNYVSIANHVVFVLNGEHYTDHISSFPFKVKVLDEKNEAFSKGDIIVDDDVWIGYGAVILSGVHIGQGAIIAAGAVVTKDVSPYSIVGGVPAKVIKYRFSPVLIEELLKVDYSKLTREMIEEHIDDLYEELKTPQQLEWMPKKG